MQGRATGTRGPAHPEWLRFRCHDGTGISDQCTGPALSSRPARQRHTGALPAMPDNFTARFEHATTVNGAIAAEFTAAFEAGLCTGTHAFDGRLENLYLDTGHTPALVPVLEQARLLAAAHLDCDAGKLSSGYWFNRMEPGQHTLPHCHDDDDELLSGVYYVSVPPASGDLLLYLDTGNERISPRAGQYVFFSPALVHAVTENRATTTRLSIGMNFGLLD